MNRRPVAPRAVRCAAHLGRNRFLTFDVDAARLPGVELLA
jgi:hypothetical protein